MDKFGFIENLEGLLGEGDYLPELLFIMREPNCQNQTNFWFKEAVVQKRYSHNVDKNWKPEGTRFYNVLSMLAKRVLSTDDEFVLHRCAYMNLYPFSGKDKKSPKYIETLEFFSKLENIDVNKNFDDLTIKKETQTVAEHRSYVIQNVVNSGVKNILTTGDIYDEIMKMWKVPSKEQLKYVFRYKYDENDKEFKKKWEFNVCYIGESKQTRLISFWHPSYTNINYQALEEIEIPER